MLTKYTSSDDELLTAGGAADIWRDDKCHMEIMSSSFQLLIYGVYMDTGHTAVCSDDDAFGSNGEHVSRGKSMTRPKGTVTGLS